MSTETKGTRIEFPADDAAKFNQLREDWRRRACGARKLPKIALRVASILPDDLNRSDRYCYPTDEQLATKLDTSTRNIGKGMKALEAAGFIERETIVRRDQKREAAGKLRRIFLTLPELAGGERNTSPDVNGTEVNGTPEVNGTVRVGERNSSGRCERNDGVPNTSDSTPDKDTSDNSRGRDESKVGVYARKAEPKGQVKSRPNPYPSPGSWGDDVDFLAAFDRFVVELIGDGEIGAGELERITQEAFDKATDSDEMFMPVHWRDLCALRTGTHAEWFRYRASSFAHGRAAA